jgi:release factor glutamine methyltransferase
MSIGEALARATEKLRAAGIDSARLDARVLLAHVMGVEPNELISNPPLEGGSKNSSGAKAPAKNFSGRGQGHERHGMTPPRNLLRSSADAPDTSQISTLPQGEGGILSEFDSLVSRRLAREPVAYIVGKKGFWDLEFAAGPGALVPRPETETLIEDVVKTFPDRNAPLDILDLGTGTGCILLTLLHLYPNATGLGVDASDPALRWAKRNATGLALESRCELRRAGWDEIHETGFDLVVSNPPYLADAEFAALAPELAYEPRDALSGGPDGLAAYRAIAPLLPRLLAPKGCAILEIGKGQGPAVSAILKAAGLEIAGRASDLSGIPRCLTARAVP